jgi:hypothetical protein
MPASLHFSLWDGIRENSSLYPPQSLPKSPCLPLSTFLCWMELERILPSVPSPSPSPHACLCPLSLLDGIRGFFPLSTAPPLVPSPCLHLSTFLCWLELENSSLYIPSPSSSPHPMPASVHFLCWLELERIFPSVPSPSPSPYACLCPLSLLAGFRETSSL